MANLAHTMLNQRLRKARIRSKVSGSAERPRLSVTVSNLHVSAQLIDDEKGHTLASATTVGSKAAGTMTEKCALIGSEIAKKAKKAKITKVVFDRNGRQYAGRLSALAEAARKEGLEFSGAEETASTTPRTDAPAGRPRGGRRDDRRTARDEAPKEFEEVVIDIDRVARVVKGGRRFRFKALVVVGNRKDKVGVGVSKGADVQTAVAKATDVAKKHLITIPIVGDTIPHEAETKISGAHVLIKPAAPGTGIIAGGVVRSVVGVTGIRNLLSKSLGSTNKVNIAYATIAALQSLVPRDQWVSNAARADAKPKAKKGGK